jgi:hypothetical protein
MNIQKKQIVLPTLLAVLLFAACESPSGPGGGTPDLRGRVSVNGSVFVGGTLTADTSLLEGAGAISYQWLKDEITPIPGATAETYVPKTNDGERTIKVRVSRAGHNGSIESDSVGPVVRDAAKEGFSLNYTLNNTLKFFSLSQGKELPASKSNTTEWDFAIEIITGNPFCNIYTNSGVTAEKFNTPGGARVWFTNKIEFSKVTLADRVTDYTGDNAQYADCADYETDALRYQYGMFVTVPTVMNIMTYWGYASGDGLSEATKFDWSSPGPPDQPFYEFNKMAFAYNTGGMPPSWEPTHQVYIIKHADGSGYSKFQITTVRYQKGYTYVLNFRFAKLAE